MNLIDRLRVLFTGEKALTGEQWKKGFNLLGVGKDKGVTLPMKDSSLVYACVRAISENLPQAVMKFYIGEDQLPVTNPIVSLFDKPNDKMNQFMFFELSTLYFALYGEVFWYMVGSKGQQAGSTMLPAELIVLNPAAIKEVKDDKGRLVGWTYNNNVALTPEEVLQIKFPNPYSNTRGLSPIDTIKADMDSDFLASGYSKQFFVNGASPSIVFSTHEDDESTPEQKREFLKEWNALHKGVSKAHKAAILEAGMDIKTVGLTQEEMAYIDSRHFNALRVLSAFGVPPPVAGYYQEATYSNVKTAKQIFWHETLAVYARRYENMINSFIVEPYDARVKAKFDFTEVNELKKDAKEVSEIVRVYAEQGIPMNTLAEVYNLPFGNVEGMDVGYIQISRVPVGSDPFMDEEPMDPNKIIDITPDKMGIKLIEQKRKKEQREKSIRTRFLQDRTQMERLFHRELKRYFFNQRSKVLKKLMGKKAVNQVDVNEIMNKIDIWAQEDINLETRFVPVYAEIMQKAGDAAIDNVGVDRLFNVDDSMIEARIKFLQGINNTTHKAVRRVVELGVEQGKGLEAIANDIKNLYSHISKTRAFKIARTETGGAMNATQIQTYLDSGVTSKRWLGGNRDSHAAVTGTVVGIKEAFTVGDSALMYPGDPTAPPEEVINCTCSISPVVGDQ